MSEMASALSQLVARCHCGGNGERDVPQPCFFFFTGLASTLSPLGLQDICMPRSPFSYITSGKGCYSLSHLTLQSWHFLYSWLLGLHTVSMLVLCICTFHIDPQHPSSFREFPLWFSNSPLRPLRMYFLHLFFFLTITPFPILPSWILYKWTN